MAGVLFIVTIPQNEYEIELRKKIKSTNIIMEKEKYEKSSKIIHELKKHKRFGNSKSSIESYATDDDSSIVISKCKSTDCLHSDGTGGLCKSKSENTLNEVCNEVYVKSSWEDAKQVIKSKRNKVVITRPPRGVDILGAFHWDTPLETVSTFKLGIKRFKHYPVGVPVKYFEVSFKDLRKCALLTKGLWLSVVLFLFRPFVN